jgi:hypothetical protein
MLHKRLFRKSSFVLEPYIAKGTPGQGQVALCLPVPPPRHCATPAACLEQRAGAALLLSHTLESLCPSSSKSESTDVLTPNHRRPGANHPPPFCPTPHGHWLTSARAGRLIVPRLLQALRHARTRQTTNVRSEPTIRPGDNLLPSAQPHTANKRTRSQQRLQLH